MRDAVCLLFGNLLAAVTEDSVLAAFVLTANELGIIVAAIASDSPAEVIRFIIDIVSLHFH